MDGPSARLMLRAEAAFRAGDYASAERVLRRVLRAQPMNSRANEFLAYIAGKRGEHEEVRARLEKATSTPEASREAWYYLGKHFVQSGEHAKAEAPFTRAIELDPGFFEALHDRGLSRTEAGNAETAVDDFDRALALRPDSFEALYNRGRALDLLKRYREAVESYDRAIALKPAHAESWTNRGAALLDMQLFEEALASFDRAIEHSPRHVEAWSGRGVTLQYLHRSADALLAFEHALQIRPGDSEVKWGEFFTRMSLGDFERGLELFELRWRRPEFELPRHADIAAWRGEESLQGKHVLAWCEQGHGDTLQFCRYLEQLTQVAAEVTLEARPPLHALLAASFPCCKVIAQGEPVPPCDFQVPLMSLPFAFRTHLHTIPANVPYLRADRRLVEAWRGRLGDGDPRMTVGIACSGSPSMRLDHLRTIPLEKFAPLARHARLVLIQTEVRPADEAWLRENGGCVSIPAEGLGGFDDSAALVECMDLVVTVDTSLAHLAGALAKPAWILLPWESEWRWLLEREDSPWYPTARLFRKGRADTWDEVMARVAAALAARCG